MSSGCKPTLTSGSSKFAAAMLSACSSSSCCNARVGQAAAAAGGVADCAFADGARSALAGTAAGYKNNTTSIKNPKRPPATSIVLTFAVFEDVHFDLGSR
jgi:hypothetical protein